MLLGASGLLLGAGAQSPAQAACVAPGLTVRPRSAPAGASIVISGTGWKGDCADTIGCEDAGPCADDPYAPPRTGIPLRFSQGRHSDALGIVDADDTGRFSYTATVPRWAGSGSATITADEVVTGFRVGSIAAETVGVGGVRPSELAAGADGAGSGEPLPRTGMEASPLLALVLAGAAAASHRLTRRP